MQYSISTIIDKDKKMNPQIFVEKLKTNDGIELKFGPSDIVIFTGANNAGKSQILKDIDIMMEAVGTKGIVATSLELAYIGDISDKEEEFKQKDGRYRLGGNIYSDFKPFHDMWENKDRRFTSLYKNRLNTEMRLQASNTSQSFDPLKSEPTTPLQRIYLDYNLEETISKLFHEAFNESLVVNRFGGNVIPVHVGNSPVVGVKLDVTDYLKKIQEIPILQDQGDGMRSFAGILFDVFTTQKTVTMIDEPEAFLHPPQARLLGRMLVKNKLNDRQLFISTHSEDFLKGLLDADSDNVKIVRINREGNVNHIKMLDNEGVKMLWKDSILRFSNILSGLFHSKVVICESDTDCRFYQAVVNALYEGKDLVSPDILFTHCGGKGRFKVVIPALKSLNVKTIVIPDIDVLDKEKTFKPICEEMGLKWEDIGSKWRSIISYVNSQRAQLNTEEVKKDIIEYLEQIATPQLSENDIDTIKKMLKASSAWAKVKEVGMNYFNSNVFSDIDDIMKKCKKIGIFIVPVGELECFYKPAANKHSSAWLNIVMEQDLASNPDFGEARKFVKEIIEY